MEVPIHKAKTDLTRLLPLVEAGQRVVITRHGKPVADLCPHTPSGAFSLDRLAKIQEARGAASKTFWMADDFNDPLPDAAWFPEDADTAQ